MKYFAGYVRAQQIEHPEVNDVIPILWFADTQKEAEAEALQYAQQHELSLLRHTNHVVWTFQVLNSEDGPVHIPDKDGKWWTLYMAEYIPFSMGKLPPEALETEES